MVKREIENSVRKWSCPLTRVPASGELTVLNNSLGKSCAGQIQKVYTNYSRTSRKRRPKMSSLGGRLRELISYWVKILPHLIAYGNCSVIPFLIFCNCNTLKVVS